ncbi:MAG: hypothetical protein K5840_07010 [Eubacterium sp.]|nr:hypothetical protein [Eubacterium sp.]
MKNSTQIHAPKSLLFAIIPAFAAVILFALTPKTALADTIHSSTYYQELRDSYEARIEAGEEVDLDDPAIAEVYDMADNSDHTNITDELEETGKVTLVSGEKYYLSKKIYLDKGNTINAKKAKIFATGRIFECNYSVKGYKKLKATVSGGIWRYDGSGGHKLTAMQFSHVNGITFRNMNIKYCNYSGHTFEFIACKNVTVKNCKIRCYGKAGSTSVEEQIQLDIDAPATAPTTGVHNGKCCTNVKIIKCNITGCRAVCANYAATDRGRYLKKFHKNITVKNCTLTGKSAEALALFNVTGATVTGNKITTKAPTSRNSYSDGMAITYFGSGASGGKYTIKNNTIKGGRHSLLMYSHASSTFGSVTIKNNKLYCKSGSSNALKTSSVSSLSSSGNKTYSW